MLPVSEWERDSSSVNQKHGVGRGAFKIVGRGHCLSAEGASRKRLQYNPSNGSGMNQVSEAAEA